MKAMQDLAERIQRADCLESLVDSILAGLDEAFGFKHSMILVPTDEDGVLVTIGSRGYAESGVGAEVRFGEGIGGMVAEARKPIRISGLMRGMLYALAMHREAAGTGVPPRLRIPLPGLANPESQLGIPLLVRGELSAVLCLESEVPYRFHEEDKASIELLGNYLAIAIQHMQLQEHMADATGQRRIDRAEPAPRAVASTRSRTRDGEKTPAPGPARDRVLRRGRVHHGRRRVPHPEPAGEDSLAAAHGVRRLWARRVHESGAAPRQVAQPARVTGTTSRAACSCCAGASNRSARTSGSCHAREGGSPWSSTARLDSAHGRSPAASGMPEPAPAGCAARILSSVRLPRV